MRYFRQPKKVYKKKRVIKRKLVKRAKPALKSFIKKVIREQTETKEAYHTTSNAGLTYFNSGINSTADMLQIIPNITQGTDDNNRIGDQIRGMSLNIKGYLRFDPNNLINDASMTNVIARLMIVSLKTKSNYTEVISSATPLNGLLKKGGTQTAFTGILSDIYAPINTDLWTVHHDKKFYLSQDYLYQPPTAGVAMVASNLKSTVKFYNMSLKIKNKLLKYDDNISSGLLPTNYSPIFLLGYSYLNAASPDTLSIKLATQFDVIFRYEDS